MSPNHVSLHIRLLRHLGVFNDHKRPLWRFAYAIYCFVSMATLTLLVLAQTIYFFLMPERDLEHLIDCGYIFCSSFAANCKGALFVYHGEKMMALIVEMNDRDFERLNAAQKRSLNRFRKEAKGIVVMICALHLTMWSATTASPLFDRTERKLPFRAWYPFDFEEHTVMYSLAYVQQAIGGFYGYHYSALLDTLIYNMLAFVALRCDIVALGLGEKLDGELDEVEWEQRQRRYFVEYEQIVE